MSDHIRRITTYLSGNMSPGEKERFETDLRSDMQLKKEYQLAILAREIIVGDADLESILNDPELPEAEKLVRQWEREDDKKPFVFKGFSWLYMAAACFAFLIIALKFLVIPNNSEKLFKEYYETIQISELTTPDMPPDLLADFQAARNYYDSGNFSEAANAFQSIRDASGTYPQILLYLGSSQIENGNTSAALQAFKEAAAIQGPFMEQASFYTGLCYIRLSDPKAAMLYLTEKTGLSKNLGDGTQKLLRRVNLINTFRFKQLRQEMSEDEEPAAVPGPFQMKIFWIVVIFMYAFTFLALWFIFQEKVKSNRNWLWLILILVFPFLGSLSYLLKGTFRKRRK